MTAGESSRVGC